MTTNKYTSDELAKWIMEKAHEVPAAKARKMLISNDQRIADSTIVGKMYFFKYDPKLKASLPKYDKYPMAIAIEQYNGGFLGLNLHYLSVSERQVYVDRLLEYKNNDYMDFRTRLKISYDLISTTRKLKLMAKPCVKRYLFNHCRSHFIEIYPSEYDKAVQLPIEDWVIKG